MHLRDVTEGDAALYVRLRCDPVMMADLGGPLPEDGIPAKIADDIRATRADESWVSIIIPDDEEPDTAAGAVALWTRDGAAEIGWMVLPEFQGRGLAVRATRMLLDRAVADGRWGTVHAYAAQSNAASNGVCRSAGFALVGAVDADFHGRILRCNHWTIATTEPDRPAPAPPA